MPSAGYRVELETEIKKSRFITTLARTDSELEARSLVAKVRSQYLDANHHCLAFVLDDHGVRMARSSDDGEPAGTAGIPMLNALTKADLVNITAVVTRYFGGIKLGAGGLTRAYGGCVAHACAGIPLVERHTDQVWVVELTHSEAGRIQEELHRCGASLVGQDYDDEVVRLRLIVPGDPLGTIARITQGSIQPRIDGVFTVERPVARQMAASVVESSR